MNAEEMSQQWQRSSQQASQSIAQWRAAHPEATLAEIEAAVDEQMNRLRAGMIEEVAQASPLEQAGSGQQASQCPQCGERMQARGKHQRRLQTHGGHQVCLTRQYLSCPACGYSFFPLDEQLALPPTALLPHAHQSLVRLSAWMPFEQAASELQALLGVQVSDSTARRQALAAGAIWEQIQTEQAQPTGSKHFPVPQEEPAERMLMSSDGGLVPLRGGAWAEVKTLVIGEVVCPKDEHRTVRSQAHTYFSRLVDAATFADLASIEVSRRGVERAKEVAAVQDGADWLQSFVDGHRHDAVRILDFAHAAGYLGHIAEQAHLVGYHLPKGWLSVLLHQLKHHGPARVLEHLGRLAQRWSLSAISEALRYFRKREPQMQYPQFQADGWPIGSGSVESGNKVVMQARLKGAGMRWLPSNVNPMLTLRTTVYNERWSEGWQQQQRWHKHTQDRRRTQRSQLRRERLLQQLRQQLVRLYVLSPRPTPASPPAPKGRTEGQRRWGRHTFSRKALHLRHAKI